MSSVRLSLGCVVTCLLASGCIDGICDPDALTSALAEAAPGDVVTVGACTLEGHFVVPAGVTLRGAGPDRTTLTGSGTAVVELYEGSEEATRLESLSVVSSGVVGVVSRGADATLRDVAVDARRGVGVGIEGGVAALERVHVRGEVTAENAGDPRWLEVQGAPIPAVCPAAPCACEPGAIDEAGGRVCGVGGTFVTWTSTFGIYARDATLTLTDVTIEGIAAYGVVTDRTSVEMIRGDVRGVLGVAVLAREGSLSMRETTLERTTRGLRGTPSYALITQDATVTSETLSIHDNDGMGAVHEGATVEHHGAMVANNGDVGLWVGSASRVVVDADSVFADNGFVGVVVNDSSDVLLDAVSVSGTATRRVSSGLVGVQEIGDGVMLSGTDAVLRAVTLGGNERAGLTVDVAGRVAFDAVTVDAAGDSLGAIAGVREVSSGQLTVGAPEGWDTGIVRTGAASANDAAASGALDVVVSDGPASVVGARGIVSPMY